MRVWRSLAGHIRILRVRVGGERKGGGGKIRTVYLYSLDPRVFAVLPTGYGKSLCLGCLPLVFDKQLGKEGEDKSRHTKMPRPSVHT